MSSLPCLCYGCAARERTGVILLVRAVSCESVRTHHTFYMLVMCRINFFQFSRAVYYQLPRTNNTLLCVPVTCTSPYAFVHFAQMLPKRYHYDIIRYIHQTHTKKKSVLSSAPKLTPHTCFNFLVTHHSYVSTAVFSRTLSKAHFRACANS